jgi:hypothetical protein
MKKAFLSPSAAGRVDRAAAWLADRSPCKQIVVATANREAASEIVRRKVLESKGGAAFGWHRATMGRLSAEIAGDALADEGLVPLTRLGTEGIASRVIQEVRGSGALDRYEVVSDKPGFARAVATTLEELRLGLVSAACLCETSARSAAGNREGWLLRDRSYVMSNEAVWRWA